MRLFHATYAKNLESIKLHGLNPKLGKRAWAISSSNEVYLSTNKIIARYYANKSDIVDKEGIVIIEIDYGQLNNEKLKEDTRAYERHKGKCFAYEGIIEPNKLRL